MGSIILQRYPIRLVTDKKGPKKDYLAYVIGIVSRGIYREGQDFNSRELSAPIWSELLKDLIGDKYKKYIAYLVKAKVILTNRQFFKGRARRYSFTEEYQTAFKPYQITDAKLIRKVKLNQEREHEQAKRKLPLLYQWIKTGKLEIDVLGAEALLPGKFEKKLEETKGKAGSVSFANIALKTWERNIENIQLKKYVSSFILGRQGGGRLYTTLTNTSRDFRPFIKYNGQTLCHVDIANSQPYFAALFLNPDFWEQSVFNASQKSRIISQVGHPGLNHTTHKFKISPNIKSSMVYQDYIDIAILLKTSGSVENQEFDKYKQFVSSGNFYHLVADEYNSNFKPRIRATKEDVKTWMFGVFFSENPPFIVESLLRPQTRLFRKLFPTISEILAVIKRNKHNTLALLLQNLESQALLHHICVLIAQKHPKIPLFTIHDSIVTTVGNEGIVEQIMQRELECLTGLSPTLRIKVWNERYDE